MKKRFYFRRPSQFSFDMLVTIADDRHEANFLASMVRKGYEIVSEEVYNAEYASLVQFRRGKLTSTGRYIY